MPTSDVTAWFTLSRYVVLYGRRRYALRPKKELSVEHTKQHSTIAKPDNIIPGG
jgi:hypothetical protein